MLKEKRNTNIEMLRIISMIMIVLSHYTVHSGIDKSMLPLGINRYLFEIFELGNIGVIIFVMITGYFSVQNKGKVNVVKILKIYFQVAFYSLSIYLIFVLMGIEKFSYNTLITCIFPITFKQYWFVTTYVILMIMTPYLNIVIDKLDKKEYLKLIIFSLIVVSIIPFFTNQTFANNEITEFILFYLIGGYLRKHAIKVNKKQYVLLIFVIAILLGSVLIFDVLETKYNIFVVNSTYLFRRKSPFAIVLSAILINIFANKKQYTNKLLNTISMCTFGIYLLHDNDFVRKILWTSVIKVKNYASSKYLLIHIIVSVIIVFVSCMIIEWLRINTVEKCTNKILNKHQENINNKVEQFYENIASKM